MKKFIRLMPLIVKEQCLTRSSEIHVVDVIGTLVRVDRPLGWVPTHKPVLGCRGADSMSRLERGTKRDRKPTARRTLQTAVRFLADHVSSTGTSSPRLPRISAA